MTKNVCIIVQNYYPADVRVRKEARALVARGHRVSIIALGENGEMRHEIVEDTKVYRVFLQKRRSGVLRYIAEYLIFFLFSTMKLNALDLKEKFDVIHINTLPDFLVFSALIQKLKGRRIVLDMHEIMPEFFMSKYGVGSKHPVVKLLLSLEKISLKFADDVITINEPIKSLFQRRAIPDKQITVVMNTMDEAAANSSVRRAHSGFNCVYHGTLTDIYGLDIALEGFAKAQIKNSNMVFHIFGDGPHLPELKGIATKLRVGDKVIFHGTVTHDKMIEWLAEMDLGVLATRKDVFLNLSFSNKLAEYIQLKIPVIASDLDTTKYYFSDENVLFFEAGNTDDLSRKIQYAYLNREAIKAKAEKAYEACKALNWKIMAQRYLEVVEKS